MELQYNKISELIEGQLPNFLQEEGPKFIKFVENYYEWMETSKLEVSVTGNLNLTSIPDTLRVKGTGSEKIVYANVLNIYSLDNGNYVFYIKEYNQDLNEVKTRGFSSGNILTFIDDNQIIEDGDTMEVISYIQNTSLSSKNLWNLQDIDRTLDEYVDFFMTEYLKGFPLSFPTQSESLDIDVEQFKKFLVKHSREFYQSKGTEDSFKYFFRSIFNKEVTVSYPKERVMSSSNNSFESTFTIFLEPNSNTVPDITSKKIKGQQSGVEYFVENVSLETISDYKVLKLELFKTTTISEFDLGETILDDVDQPIGKIYHGGSSIEILNTTDSFPSHQRFFVNRNGELVEYKDIPNSQKGSLLEIMLCDVNSGDLTDINVSNGGSGYSVDQNLVFDNTNCFENEVYQRPIIASVSEVDENGAITKIKVRRVGRGYVKIPEITHIGDIEVTSEVLDIVSVNVGTIKEIKIKNSGFGYSLSEIELDLNNSGQNNIKINFGSVFDDGGKFLNENSFLSDFKVLQDSSYYQTFSYVVESSLQIYKYKDLLKALIHPAGMKMFGTISSENKEDSRMVSVDSVLKIPFHIEKIINKYSDVPINKIQGNISRVVPYDGGENSDYANLSHEIFEGGGPPNEGAISDIADLHIDSVSSWSELHQVYKHKYLNLRAGFHEKSYFKFEEIQGLRASIDLDGKTASISQTFFVNVTKEDNRDFNDDDFIAGDVVYQGDSYETSISRSLIENWNSETGELELLKTQGDFDPDVEFKVNSYTKNILFDDLNSVDSNFLNICKKIKIDSDFDKISEGEIIYQGVDIDNTTFKSEVLGVDYFNDGTQEIKVSIISGELSSDLIKIDIIQITSDENAPDTYDTYAFTKLDDYDISIIETRNVLNICKKIKIDSDFDKISEGEIIYQGVDIDNTTFKSEVLGVDYFNDGTQEIKVSIISGELSDDLIKIDILQITTDENAPDIYDTYAFTKLDESDFIKLEKISYENILSVTLNEEYSLSVDTEVYQEDSEGVIISKGKIVNFISGDLIISREFGDFSESVLKINTDPDILNLNIGNVKNFEGFDDSEYFVEGELIVQGDFDNSTFSANVTFWDSSNQYLYYDDSFGQVVTNSKINKLFENYILKVNTEDLISNEFLENDILYQGDVSNPTFKISVNSWNFSTGDIDFNLESGTINPIKPLKFRKSQSIFDLADIGEKINLSPTPNLLVGDFLYKGQASNQESYSSITSVNGSDVTVKTSLGEISNGDQLKTIKNYTISNLHKSFILQDKTDDDNDPNRTILYNNEFSVGETIYQGDSLENSTFSGVVSHWDKDNKNLELDNTSGLIQNNQKLKKDLDGKVSSDINSIVTKNLNLDGNILEIINFLPDDEIFQGDSYENSTINGVISSWDSNNKKLIITTSNSFSSEEPLKKNENTVNSTLTLKKKVDGNDDEIDFDGTEFVEGDVVRQQIDGTLVSSIVQSWDSVYTVTTTLTIKKQLDGNDDEIDFDGTEFVEGDVVRQQIDGTVVSSIVQSWDAVDEDGNSKNAGTLVILENGESTSFVSGFDKYLYIVDSDTLSTDFFNILDLSFENLNASKDVGTLVILENGTQSLFQKDYFIGEYEVTVINSDQFLNKILEIDISGKEDLLGLDLQTVGYDNYSPNEQIYQGDNYSSGYTARGLVVDWNSSNGEMLISVNSGDLHFDVSSSLLKNGDFNNVQSKELILILNQSEKDFESGDFAFSQTITQQNNDGETSSGEVLDWNHITGVLDLEIPRPLDVDEVPKDFEDGYSVSGFNVHQVEKILDVGTIFDDIFGQKFSSGDVIYQGDVSSPTAEAKVLDWNNFEGILTIEPIEGLESFDKLDSFKIQNDSTDESFTIDKVINRLILDKTKIDFSGNDFKSEDGKIFQEALGQVGEENPPFESDYVNWNESTGELRIDLTSGVFDSSLPIKQESVNSTITIQKKLDEDDEEIDFDGSEFVVGGTISQQSFAGEAFSVVQSWDQNTGELVILETDTTETLFKINLEVNSYNVTEIVENGVKESIFTIKSTVEKVELSSTYSTNYLRNETVYQEDDSGNIIFEGVIDHWDSGDNKLKLIPTLGTSHISKVLKKLVDTFEIEEIREIFNVTNSSQFSVSDIFYQNDYNHSYSVLQVNGDKIYCGYNQDEMLDSDFVILKDGTVYNVNSIQQENLSLYRNNNSSSFDNFELNDFVIGETIYQGDFLNPTAEATVTNWDISNGELSINLTSGKFIKSESIKNNIEYDDFTIYGEIKTGSTDLIKFGDSLSFVEDLNDVLDDNGLFRVLNVDDLNNEIRLNICSGKKHENSIILKRVSFDG